MSTLYIVATPIGNLEDITLRALRILKESDLILAEDTRVTKKLLSHYEIPGPVTSYHEYTSPGKMKKLIGQIQDGTTMALVTDAGTPGISDPGARFVEELVQDAGVQVVPVPGASAVTALLSASGLPSDSFVFHGFPPHKKGRAKFFKTIAEEKRPSVFYESPHRVEKAMKELAEVCEPERRIVIGRELTKKFESIRHGTIGNAAELLTSEPVKGEYVIAVQGK